jgi:hypothetical protein
MLLRQPYAAIEDLRNHSPQHLAELRELLDNGANARPDARRPGFYEVQGDAHVYYVFVYPAGSKVMLIGVWENDPLARLVSCSCSAA